MRLVRRGLLFLDSQLDYGGDFLESAQELFVLGGKLGELSAETLDVVEQRLQLVFFDHKHNSMPALPAALRQSSRVAPIRKTR